MPAPGNTNPAARLQVSRSRMPRGALSSAGLQGGTPAAVPVGQRALRDGGSAGDTGQRPRYRPRAGAAKPACCSGSRTGAAERSASPSPPSAREGSAPGAAPTRTHPAAQCPDTQALPCRTVPPSDGAARLQPWPSSPPSLTTAQQQHLALLRAARQGFKLPPPVYTPQLGLLVAPLGASISAGDGGGCNLFLPVSSGLARGTRVDSRLSPHKQPVSPHSARVRALTGRNMRRRGKTLFMDSPALNGPSQGGRPGEGLGAVYGRAASIRSDPAPSPPWGGASAVAPPRSRLRGWGDTAAPRRRHLRACVFVSLRCAFKEA